MVQIVLRQTTAFSRQLQKLDGEIHFQELAGRLKAHPELGDVIPSTGGLRKIRLALPGKGSRGGARIIYIWLREAGEIFFLWLYAKGEAADLTAKEKKALAALAAEIKAQVQNAKEKKEDNSLGEILFSGLQEVLAHVQGKITLKEVVLPERVRNITPKEIKALRDKMNVSQAMFALILNVPTVTAISWEKGRRKPTGAALRLLDLARKDPQRVLELAHSSK